MPWFLWWFLIWGVIAIIVSIDVKDRERNAFAWAVGVLFLGLFVLVPYIAAAYGSQLSVRKEKIEKSASKEGQAEEGGGVSDRIKLDVYDYVVKHEGEIDLKKCATELRITRETLGEAIKALETDGKLERE